MDDSLAQLDEELAQHYGAYASYRSDIDPVLVESYGDHPSDEVNRLLNVFAQPECSVLDLGCGAGHTLCRLAPHVNAIWGLDQDTNLLAAARLRAASLGLPNVTLVQGDATSASNVAQLPDNTFDLCFSRRGPNLNAELAAKLKPDALMVQELVQDPLGLKELFGRKPFLPEVGSESHALVQAYKWLGLLPVSAKEYFYNEYFHDVDHLTRYLSGPAVLSNWWMPEMPYDASRDRAALELYVRYNTTAKGIRLTQHRKVYLFHRAHTDHYPADPDAKPHL